MKLKLRIPLALVCLFVSIPGPACCDLVTFEELGLADNSFYNGGPVTNSNGWQASAGTAGDVHFGNRYDSSFGGFWNGFSYSSVTDTTTPGFTNQYAAYPGSGADGSSIYAVGYAGSHAWINLQVDQRVESVQLTNTTYAALSMQNGDSFSKQFGGASGDDPDYFSVTFTGYSQANATGIEIGSVEYFLADYRFVANELDYIVEDWESLSLAGLANARSIGISFDSSDIGGFGINTPTYVALDNLVVSTVPEPSGLTGFCLAALAGLGKRRRLFYDRPVSPGTH